MVSRRPQRVRPHASMTDTTEEGLTWRAEANLPEGWVSVPLGEVTEGVANVKPEEQPCRVWKYVDISAIDNQVNQITECKAFRGAEAPSRARRPIASGDVLFSNVRTYLRNIAVVPHELDGQIASTGFTVMRPNGAVLSLFLFRWVLTDAFVDAVTPQQTGSNYPATCDRVVLSQLVPLPPLAEQKRIVAKVEVLLARVNATRDRLARMPEILKRFRQSVLTAACSGRLTEDWRTPSSDVDSSRPEADLPSGWQRLPLAALCDRFDYGTSKKSGKDGSVPVLRMGNIQGGSVDWSDLVFTSDEAEIEKYSLAADTVLFNRTNSPELVGKTGIYMGERPAIFAGYLIRIVHGDRLNPRYVNHCLNAPDFREYCHRVKTDGVNQSNINATKLAAYEMPWCPIVEQQEIVRRVGVLFDLADRVEQRVAAATDQAEKLTQSVLAKAFRGELVPTEAELARTERRDYELTSELLARIKAEREAEAEAGAKPKRQAKRKSTSRKKRKSKP